MPANFEHRYGVNVQSFVRGSWIEYLAEDESAIVTELVKLGWASSRRNRRIASWTTSSQRWWALRGSNPRPSDYESPALTD